MSLDLSILRRTAAPRTLRAAALSALVLLLAGALPAQAQGRVAAQGDYIAAIVNQELVTAGELERRYERARADAARAGTPPPADAVLRKQAFDSLIDERVILSSARESGMRVDDTELDRAVQSVAAQNQISAAQLRERLRSEGIDYARFRADLRDQIMIERMREREVYRRIVVSDDEIDQWLAQQRVAPGGGVELNLAQILVSVPENADEATLAARRARIDQALARVRAGEPFAKVAAEMSEDANHERGGEIGLRPASRLPDLFVEAVRDVPVGGVSSVQRSGAGFHILEVLARHDGAITLTQTHVRHVLLRTSAELTPEVAARRLAEYRQQIESGKRKFEDIARQYSEDGSAAAGGDLGWAAPGTMVPEFESAMDALPIGGISQPVVSRFGVHLIQVLERRDVALDARQLREQARNALRERKFEQAYLDWVKELRSRAYVEYREPPQ
ncbi:MAG: peptidylprolyl isomerase [Proteobacteria bacterium]|nr:peptidylprolyl isomerase [Pseudomonadota bacterium]